MEIEYNRFYHIPKPLLKNGGFTPTEKLFITVALQYFNAGAENACTLKAISKNTGITVDNVTKAYNALNKDGFCKMEKDNVLLNCFALFQEGVLEYESFYDPSRALQLNGPKKRK